MLKRGFLVLLMFTCYCMLIAQDTERPPLWGIARMTFRISGFDMAREYYGRFLGFDEAFTYQTVSGQVLVFKVNDRQYLEFIEDKQTPDRTRLISLSLETSDVEQMLSYLKVKGWDVPPSVTDDGAGNLVFSVKDYSGNCIEFLEYGENGLHRKSKGNFLSPHRIANRIHHAGLYTKDIRNEDPFYCGVLRFSTILRYPEDQSVKPVIIYYGMVDCAESIEHYASDDINISHPCFLVEDMQETVYTLKERNGGQLHGKPMIGRGKRWILNLNNPDGTKVEFTEQYTVK